MSDKNEIIISKSIDGLRVDGYIDGKVVISVSNFNLGRKFEVSQGTTLVGDMVRARAINKIMNDVLDKVETLKESCEGKVSIDVVKRNDGWMMVIDGFDTEIEKNRNDAISLAEHFKKKYENAGVIVSYSLKF